MISKKLVSRLVLGSAAVAVTASIAFAGPIEDRQNAMKQVGKAMGGLVAIMKGEAAYDAAAVKGHTDSMLAAFETASKSFPEGSDKGDVETWAKPEIWSDMEGFKAAGEKAGAAIVALAATTDEAAFKAAFPAVGEGCKGCHEKFRRPKE
jgi:cytochrome c556